MSCSPSTCTFRTPEANPAGSVNARVQLYFPKLKYYNSILRYLPLSKLRMHSLSSMVAFALASLHLVPAVLAIPWTSSDPAHGPVDATAPRGLHLLNRGYDDDDFHDFYIKDDDEHQVWASLERTFGIIIEIPDSVLEKGDAETHKWLVNHGHRSDLPKSKPPPPPLTRRDMIPKSRRSSVQELAPRNIFDVLRCVGAITAFLATNAIGAAKILRIKKYIGELGGVRESAQLLLQASKNIERLKEGGEALALLAGEILGVPLIAKNC